MIENHQEMLSDFYSAFDLWGLSLPKNLIRHELLSAPHEPKSLPSGNFAVYVFSIKAPSNQVLKIGRVGPNSNARFVSQHYRPGRAKSSLAASLLKSNPPIVPEMLTDSIGDWIKSNCDRDHFFIPAKLQNAQSITNLLEAYLQARLLPLFEG